MTLVASEENEGVITYLSGTYEPCICIFKYNNWMWENIVELSPKNFEKYREKITTELDKILKENRKSNKRRKIIHEPNPEEYKLMEEMFGKLTKEEKIEFMKKFTQTKLSKNFCSSCAKFCEEKFKCMFRIECGGFCSECKELMGKNPKVCIACAKIQEKECPICYEKRNMESMALFDTCDHACCWKCITHSYVSKSPIENCPECREKITIEFK
jgi:hypothetical protein